MKFFKLFLAGLLIHGMGSCSVAVAGPGDTRIRADYVDGQDSSRNYIKDGDAETGTAVKGWTCYNDSGEGATTSPVNGTGGTPNVTFTKTTSSPLENNNSFVFTKDAANRQGQGCSYDFTIDSRLKSKMLQITFDNLVGSGAFAAGSDTTNSDVMVYLYDITNSKLIPLQGQTKFYSNSTTLAESFKAWFQSAPDSVNYRLILHVASTSASAFTLKSDVFKVSESKQVVGTIITEWQSYTPTLSSATGAVSNYTISGRQRRVGDTIELSGVITFSSTSSAFTAPFISLPSGLSVDTTKLSGSVVSPVGQVYIRDAGITNLAGVARFVNSNSTIQLEYVTTNTSDAGSVSDPALFSIITNTTPITFNTSDEIIYNATLPIAGWSAGARMPDGYDGRVIGYYANLGSGSQTVTAGSQAVVVFNSEKYDEDNSYDISTGLITAKKSGRLFVAYGLRFATGGTAPTSIASVIYKNGTSGTSYSAAYLDDLAANKLYTLNGTAYIDVVAGDTIGVYSVPTGQNITHPATVGNYITAHWMSGTPFMAPTASVAESWAGTAGDAIDNSGASVIKFTTKDDSTYGSYNPATGIFTAPENGRYVVSWNVRSVVNLSTTQRYVSVVNKNGSTYKQGSRAYGVGTSVTLSSGASVPMYLKTGDTIKIIAYSEVSTTADTDLGSSFLSIVKVAN